MAVQDILKSRWEPWRWETQWPSHWKFTVTNWEQLPKLILLQLHEKLLKNSVLTILWSFSIWSKLQRWRNSIRGCQSVVFSYPMQQQWTVSIRLWHAIKSGFYRKADDGWLNREDPKHFSKPNLHQEKVMVTGGLLLIWSTTAFWILAKTLHQRSMLSKSMRCTENCNTCSWHWSTESAQFFSMTTPDQTSHSQCFKSWTNWAMKFCLICHIHLTSCQLTTTSSSILTTFCRENVSTTSRRQKMLSKSLSNPKACIFMLQEQTNLFLNGKNVLIEWFLFWLIKMCLSVGII